MVNCWAAILFRVGREAEAKLAGESQHNGSHPQLNGAVELDMDKEMLAKTEQEESKRATGVKLKFQQFKAMIVKKCIYAVRNRVLLLVQVAPPIFLMRHPEYDAVVMALVVPFPYAKFYLWSLSLFRTDGYSNDVPNNCTYDYELPTWANGPSAPLFNSCG